METLRKIVTRSLPVMALGCALSAAAIAAPTFRVDVTYDAHDANPGDGVCASNTGKCSLRAAVQEANALSSGGEPIQIQLKLAQQYTLQSSSGSANSAQLDVSGKMRITGGYDSNWRYQKTNSIIKLDDNIDSRVIHVQPGADLTLNNITVTGGNVIQYDGGGSQPGAGIYVRSDAYLAGYRLNVTGNRAMNNNGGGIYNDGYLELFQSNISDNESTDDNNGGQYFSGGAIYNGGIAVLDQTSIVNNKAIRGGAIHTTFGSVNRSGEEEPNTLRLNAVTITGNVAHYSGSAISSEYGNVEIAGSTIYNNSSVAGSDHYPKDGAIVMNGGDTFFDPSYTPNVSNGQSVFLSNCTTCHGNYKIEPENYTYKSMASKIHNTMGFRASPDCLDQCAQDIAAYLMQGTPTTNESPLHGEVPALKVYSSIIAKNSSYGSSKNCLLGRGAQFGVGSGYNVWGDLSGDCSSSKPNTDIELGRQDEDSLEFDLITLDVAQGTAFKTQYPNESILTFYYQDGANHRVAKPVAGTAAWKNIAPSVCPPASFTCDLWHNFDGALSGRSEPTDAGAWEEKF